MHRTRIAFGIAVALLLAGCSNPLNYRVSKLTRDQRADLHAVLTADQSAELDAWIQRHTAGGAPLPAGVTVDQALKDQEAWLAARAAEKRRAAELQEQRMAAMAAKQQQLARLVSVSLLSKTNKVLPDDRRYVALELQYSNNTDKEVTAIKGKITLVNIYGEPVIAVDWSYGSPIGSKHSVIDHDAGLAINPSVESQVALWDTDYDKLKFTFEIRTIAFKDGTSVGAS